MLVQEVYTLASADRTVGSECIAAGYGSSLPEGQGSRLPSYENVTITDCEGNATGQICAGVKTDTDVHGILCLVSSHNSISWHSCSRNKTIAHIHSRDSCGQWILHCLVETILINDVYGVANAYKEIKFPSSAAKITRFWPKISSF